jgi:hypothetical protein
MKLRYLLLLPLYLALTGCPRCPEAIELNHGPLPDEALQYIPYRTGEIYRFKHSRDRVVEFFVRRGTYSQTTSCSECCDYVITYEVNATELTPDYPLFSIRLEISNIDTSFFWCTAQVGGCGFTIPTNGPETGPVEKFDSVMVDSVWYHDVYKIGYSWGCYPGEEVVHADTILYNYTDGILKIIMSNAEYYSLSKE